MGCESERTHQRQTAVFGASLDDIYDIGRIFDHFVSLDQKRRKAKNGPRRTP